MSTVVFYCFTAPLCFFACGLCLIFFFWRDREKNGEYRTSHLRAGRDSENGRQDRFEAAPVDRLGGVAKRRQLLRPRVPRACHRNGRKGRGEWQQKEQRQQSASDRHAGATVSQLSLREKSFDNFFYLGEKKTNIILSKLHHRPPHRVINFIDWCYNSLSSAPTELRIIAKLSPSDAFRRHAYSSTEHFAREKYTFETLLPAFTAFETRAANACPAADKISPPYKAFDSYPTVLAASDTEFDEYILLKDLKAEGFRNHERTQPLDEQHIRVVLERLAHFHAISFAYRYREPVAFKALTARLREIMFVRPVKPEMQSFLEPSVAFVLDALREIAPEERELVDRIDAFRDVYVDSMASCTDAAWSDEGIADECAVLHGDCWISNLMFRRQGGCGGGDDAAADNNEAPLDVKFVDWQVTRYGSVAVDLSYFLFCCTDETTRRNIDEKLCIYHEALVRRIAVLLGGGPDNDDIAANMMPMARLRWHMKKYARFGLGE